jgi:urease accessory protein
MSNLSLRRTILACSPWAAAAVAATVSTAAQAHVGGDIGLAHTHDALGSFMAGAAHPLTGLDHLAAMISVGLWSALGAGAASPLSATSPSSRLARLWAAPLAFAATLLVGALMALAGVTLPGVEPMIAASLMVMGLLVATRAALPTAVGAALVAGFALFHGLAHGQELGGHAAAALSGMLLSTIALHAVGMSAGLALRSHPPSALWLPRAAGTGVAALGLSLLSPAAAGLF